jgi:hypothetical protein
LLKYKVYLEGGDLNNDAEASRRMDTTVDDELWEFADQVSINSLDSAMSPMAQRQIRGEEAGYVESMDSGSYASM